MVTSPFNPDARLQPITRRDVLWLGFILILAAALRLGVPAALSFNYDQAEVTLLAQQVASGESFPLLGQASSGGLPNSPMAHLLLALPFAILREPYPVTVFIALWNVAGVGVFWLLVHRYIDPRLAVVAALLVAVNPAAASWSRSIWIQNIHTPIILLALLLTLYGVVERVPWAQAAFLPVWFMGMQIHYAAWALLPLMLWLVWRGRRQIRWPMVVIGLILAVLVMLPMVLGFADLLGREPTALSSLSDGAPLRLRSKVFYRVLPIFTGLNIELPDKSLSLAVLLDDPLALVVGLALGLLTLGGFVAAWLRSEWRGLAILMTLWVVLPVLAFWPSWTGVYGHYFVPVVPGFCLLGGVGFTWLLARSTSRPAAVLLRVALAGVLVFQIASFLTTQTQYSRSYEVFPRNLLLRLLPVRDALRSVDDVLIVGGQSSFSGHEVWEALLYHSADRVGEVVTSSGGVAVLPAGPFALLTAPRAEAYPLAGMYEDAASVQVYPLREGEGGYTVALFDQSPAWTGPPITPVAPARFASGATLTGYALTADRIYTQWTLPDAPAERTQFAYFVHLLDAAGNRAGQQDTIFWPQSYWRADDTVILWADHPAPDAAISTLRIGQYALLADGNIRGLDVLDEANIPMAPWVDVPLVGE